MKPHTSWRYRRRRSPQEQQEFSAAQSQRVRARWARMQAEHAGERQRQTRVLVITIQDSHRPRCVLRLSADETPHGWSRWHAQQNDQPVGNRSFGKRKLAAMIADYLS